MGGKVHVSSKCHFSCQDAFMESLFKSKPMITISIAHLAPLYCQCRNTVIEGLFFINSHAPYALSGLLPNQSPNYINSVQQLQLYITAGGQDIQSGIMHFFISMIEVINVWLLCRRGITSKSSWAAPSVLMFTVR